MFVLLCGGLQGQLENELVLSLALDNSFVDDSPSQIQLENRGADFLPDRNGNALSAAQFEGSDRLTFESGAIKVDLPITISTWVNLGTILDSYTHAIFSSDDIFGSELGYEMKVQGSRIILSLGTGLSGSPTANKYTYTTVPTLSNNSWHHVVGIIRAHDDMTVYVDCVEQSGTYDGTGPTTIFYSQGESNIGWSPGNSSEPDGFFLDGLLDDFQIWSRELTLMEVEFLCMDTPVVGSDEICDDGIDNDGDGLIDINDEDCICLADVPTGLIPNPSFEEMSCCPDRKEELDCAESWIQASDATTDYVHTCDGFLGHPDIQGAIAPLPMPDGEGAVGFRDGVGFSSGGNYKEYTGAYLLSPLEIGAQYRFDFYVGFPDRDSRFSIMEIGVYASDRAGSLPFGGNNSSFGCPTNGAGWDQLGLQEVEGRGEWVNVIFEFTPTKAYSAIVIGPGCDPHPQSINEPYYFLDRLALAAKSDFLLPLNNVTGFICDDDLTLEAEEAMSYQWYYNGIAILGETERVLSLDMDKPEGAYQVMMIQEDGCFISSAYNLDLGFLNTRDTISLCDGDTYVHGNQVLDSEGVYVETIALGLGCDSVSTVDIVIIENSEYADRIEICEGDSVEVAGIRIHEEGLYEYNLLNAQGCDSLIMIDLQVNSDFPEISVQETFDKKLGDALSISFESLSSNVDRIEWYDQGVLISEAFELIDYLPLESTLIEVVAYNQFGCSTRSLIAVEIDKTVDVYSPNIVDNNAITPDNTFLVGAGKAVDRINDLSIYDRWGSLLYRFSGENAEFTGWNMRHNDRLVEQGVYTFIIEVRLINGEKLKRAGDFLFIR